MSRPLRIRILTLSLVPNDAIANDVIQMRDALRDSGHHVEVFAQGVDRRFARLARPLDAAPQRCWESPDDILIYHHSHGWSQGEEILFGTGNRVVFRTHNVTPAKFFATYSAEHAAASEAGLECARRAAWRRDIVILGDSVYNCEDMVAMGAAREDCRVLPPMHFTEELGCTPFSGPVLERCGRDCVNVLFVGGVKPNKGHTRALRAFAEYHHYGNPHSRLIFAGGVDERLKIYVLELRQLVSDLDLEGAVVFTGGITASELKSYYVSAAVFLCASEHEGFCVPLIESMYFRVPIVAAAAGAVPETLGDCGLLLDDWEEAKVASAIAAIVEDQDLAIDLGNRGRSRYLRLFQESVLRKQACQAIEEIRTALPKERGGEPAR